MSLLIFNQKQELFKLFKRENIITLEQDVEINSLNALYSEIPVLEWDALEEKPFYLGVKDTLDRKSFHIYRIMEEEVGEHSVYLTGIHIGYDELKGRGVVPETIIRQQLLPTILGRILEGSGWRVGFVDEAFGRYDLELEMSTKLDAMREVLKVVGAEIEFKITVKDSGISDKRIDVYRQLGGNTGRRFAYGGDLVRVVKEENISEVVTALHVLGKEYEEKSDDKKIEPVTKRLDIREVEWSTALGDPVNKPRGSNVIELKNMTKLYGYPDGSPREGVYENSSAEDDKELIQGAYDALVEFSRPKVQFQATVRADDGVRIGETVAIIRPELNFRYLTRVFKIRRNLLNQTVEDIQFGDVLVKTELDRYTDLTDKVQSESDRIENIIQGHANGKNRIFRGPNEPTQGMVEGDLWYKTLGGGDTEVYQWDGDMWVLIIGAGINKQIQEELDKADEKIKEAAEKIAGSEQEIADANARIEEGRKNALEASKRIEQAIKDAEDAYSYADSAQKSADGKNTVYRGTSRPEGAKENDLWYEYRTEQVGGVSKDLVRLHVHDGTSWELRADDASNLGGTLDLSTLNTINLNFDSGTGGSLNLNRGIKIVNNGKDVLKAQHGNVTMDVDNLLIGSTSLDSKMGTKIYQDKLNTGMLFQGDDGRIKSVINVGADGIYLGGKNIILDGDTDVSNLTVTNQMLARNFTVTNEMLAKDLTVTNEMLAKDLTVTGKMLASDASILNLKGKTLNFSEMTAINFNAKSIVGENANLIRASFNAISDSTQIEAGNITMIGSGTYRKNFLTETGLELFNGLGSYNRAGAIGYFKSTPDKAPPGTYHFNKPSRKHSIGMAANSEHDVVLGYNSDPKNTTYYGRALQVDGINGDMRLHTKLKPGDSDYYVNLNAYDYSPYYGPGFANENGGIIFGRNATYLWDSSANQYDAYNMETRTKYGLWGGGGLSVNTSSRRTDLYGGGGSLAFWVGTSTRKMTLAGNLDMETGINMGGYQITNQSDRRLKENIQGVQSDSLSSIKEWDFVNFEWKEENKPDGVQFGLIAQDTSELATYDEDSGFYSVDTSKQLMMTSHAVQQLAKRVEELEGIING